MERGGKSNFVLMIISDEFLRSDKCMYEVTKLLNTHEFKKRILPVVLDNAAVYLKLLQELNIMTIGKKK
jgi:hypothetical protein